MSIYRNGTVFEPNDKDAINSDDICNLHKSARPYNIFKPNDTLKIIWEDNFNGDKIDQSKWEIIAHRNKCESTVRFLIIRTLLR